MGITRLEPGNEEESWARLDTAVQAALDIGASYQLTLEFICPDGTRKTVVARGEPVWDANGELATLIGTVQDVSESKPPNSDSPSTRR